MDYEQISSREWFPPDGGDWVPGIPKAQSQVPNVELSIILAMIADDLAVEIAQSEQEHEGIDLEGLWYIQEQVEKYSAWARGEPDGGQ